MNQKPLTAHDLAEALGCFSNAAIGAMHNGTHIIGCIAQGIDAVVWRLQEIAEAGADQKAALTLANARIARLEEALMPFADAAEEENLQPDALDDCMVDYSDGLVVGDLRRARAALKGDA